jgi:hypothetical protein
MQWLSVEGQLFQLDDAIASEDQKIRDYLSCFLPDMGNAQIIREPGKPILVSKAPGKKGSTLPLDVLKDAPEEVNPAVLCARRMQALELMGQLTPLTLAEHYEEIQSSSTLGLQWASFVEESLKTLKESVPVPSKQIPLGF